MSSLWLLWHISNKKFVGLFRRLHVWNWRLINKGSNLKCFRQDKKYCIEFLWFFCCCVDSFNKMVPNRNYFKWRFCPFLLTHVEYRNLRMLTAPTSLSFAVFTSEHTENPQHGLPSEQYVPHPPFMTHIVSLIHPYFFPCSAFCAAYLNNQKNTLSSEFLWRWEPSLHAAVLVRLVCTLILCLYL